MNKKHMALTRKGYAISNQMISDKTISALKKELTVTPYVNYEYGAEAESFKVYRKTNNHLYVPRYYGINKFGLPKKKLIKCSQVLCDST